MNPELIGWIGCLLNAIVLFPQAFDVIRTRRVRDVSLTTYILIVINSFVWVAYGFFIYSQPLIVTNLIQLGLSGTILFLKLKYR